MVMQKLRRNAAMDGIDLFRRMDTPRSGSSVADPARIDAVVEELRTNLTAGLSTPTTVAGWRAQALFGSLVAALDECDLMTFVDTGEIFYADGSVKAADYFLHLRSGRRLLVDVKSVEIDPAKNLKTPVKFGTAEIERMRRFGDRFGAEVFLALYFPAASTWSLVALDDLVTGPGGAPRITFERALLRNQISLLGDRRVGTVFPLEFIARPDPSAPNTLTDDSHAQFTIGDVELRAGGITITDEHEKQLLMFFMLYGSWDAVPLGEADGDKVAEVRWEFNPHQDHNQGFEILGSLSEMYSRMFDLSTADETGPTALDITIDPGTLITLIPHDFDFAAATLPLWVFATELADED